MRPVGIVAALCMTHALACASPAHAGVVLANTRVVFPGDAREVTVRLDNRHAHPVLVEAWVERGGQPSRDGPTIVPFAPHPPLVRIDPGKGQALRVHRLPGPLPSDRETLFWLNVLDVPPDLPVSMHASAMKIALHTRVKLFHRPVGLAGIASKAPAALRWSLRDGALHIENPTPFHVSIARVVVGDGLDLHGDMVAPFGALALRLDAAAPGKAAIDVTMQQLAARRTTWLQASRRVSFDAINDVGGKDRFDAALQAFVERAP
ncbi:molecular chaperone [Lysobacter sp. A6]|uniref:Molecular chaperone n=1 Tax=Noviluteimonas lactosilytica TaxID=2888523 RepID=A0ABS8JLT2_9GAMM|nr:molecular chaperone [Lysobacter lactosilyticus]MCC8364551.1 molecular chaperone [Lysobacter lactosilyticus]